MITLKGFWFLRSLISQKSEVFSSVMIGSERGFSDFPEVLWSISFSVLENCGFHLLVLLTFKIFEVVSRNLKLVCLYLLDF